jgi:toxin ParE1/3/4
VAPPIAVRWTRSAAGHLRSAFEYLDAENPRAAIGSVERILAAVERLARFPQMGRAGRVPGTRELVLTGTPFLVAYRQKGRQIEVLALLHGTRKWPEKF